MGFQNRFFSEKKIPNQTSFRPFLIPVFRSHVFLSFFMFFIPVQFSSTYCMGFHFSFSCHFVVVVFSHVFFSFFLGTFLNFSLFFHFPHPSHFFIFVFCFFSFSFLHAATTRGNVGANGALIFKDHALGGVRVRGDATISTDTALLTTPHSIRTVGCGLTVDPSQTP